MPTYSKLPTSSVVISCPQCGELNSSHVSNCVICRSILPSSKPTDANEKINETIISDGLKTDINQQISTSTKNLFSPLLFGGAILIIFCAGLLWRNHSAAALNNSSQQAPISTSANQSGPSASLKQEVIPDVVSTQNAQPQRKLPSNSGALLTLDEQFFQAASKGDLALLQRLHKEGASINARSISGVPALVTACNRAHASVVAWLLANGANVNIRMPSKRGGIVSESDSIGWTALMLTCAKGSEAVVKLLLAHGADIKAANEEGMKAIHCAAINQNGNIIRMLIDHGADPNEPDKNGLMPILLAANEGNTQAVKVLLEKGVDPNSRGPLGKGALSHAVETNHPETAQALREAGAR